MAVSTIKHDLNVSAYNAFEVRGLEFRMALVTAQHKTWTDVTFDYPFTHAPIVIIPICAQVGFSSPSTITSQNSSAAGTQVYQANSASAAMQVRVLAIGY